ncbi:MAG TPA: tRNA lysidine(34) synthetase TilS, partial [Patescibacteria group bacterium]|nr:tRNA lysidine(34) synthetase TilS [Patescibacteria group bacterium]
VDSISLLHLLVAKASQPKSKIQLIVAHYDHGIRANSSQDRKFVQQLAKDYGLVFVYDEGHLGPDASEATARQARYDFLHRTRLAGGADAIITAHHQDDVIETAILNILRGTGRKGLTALKSTDLILRPLLDIPKDEIIKYAKEHKLKWQEDETNQDDKYLRNYVRHKILPKFDTKNRAKLNKIIADTKKLNDEIEEVLTSQLHIQPALNRIDRHWFTMLPHEVAREVMATWLRRHNIRDFSTKTLDRLIVAAKAKHPGKVADIDDKYFLRIETLSLKIAKRV